MSMMAVTSKVVLILHCDVHDVFISFDNYDIRDDLVIEMSLMTMMSVMIVMFVLSSIQWGLWCLICPCCPWWPWRSWFLAARYGAEPSHVRIIDHTDPVLWRRTGNPFDAVAQSGKILLPLWSRAGNQFWGYGTNFGTMAQNEELVLPLWSAAPMWSTVEKQSFGLWPEQELQ